MTQTNAPAPAAGREGPPVGRIVLTVVGALAHRDLARVRRGRRRLDVGVRHPARLGRVLHQRHRTLRDADLRDHLGESRPRCSAGSRRPPLRPRRPRDGAAQGRGPRRRARVRRDRSRSATSTATSPTLRTPRSTTSTSIRSASRTGSQAGGAPAEPPGTQRFWAASAQGPGVQRLEWELESGRWAVVVMNADASRGVGADVSVGVKVDWVLPLGIGLLWRLRRVRSSSARSCSSSARPVSAGACLTSRSPDRIPCAWRASSIRS